MTSSYFENLVNSMASAKSKSGICYDLDLVYSAIEILKQAEELQELSLSFFETSEEKSDDMYWRMSCEADKQAKGLLDAYELITRRKVLNVRYAIGDEIDWIADTFDLA